MASLAFFAYTASVAGTNAAAAPLTTLVGGLFFGVFDQLVLMPKLFPAPDNEGPKFDDTRLQSASEGMPINRCYGGASRMGGQVLWMSDLQKIETLAATTGKGGGYQAAGDQYKIDVAVAFCGNEVETIDRIHTDGKLLSTEDPDLSVTETGISAETPTTHAYTELRQTPLVAFEDVHIGLMHSGVEAGVSGFLRQSTFTHTNPAGANTLFFNGTHFAGDTSIAFDANGSFSLSGNVAENDSFTIAHGGSIGTVRYYFTGTGGTSLPGTVNIKRDGPTDINWPGLAADVSDNTQITVTSGVNGTFLVQSAGTNISSGYHWCRLDNNFGQDIAAGSSITVAQIGVSTDPSKVEEVTIYTGTDYQEPDPTMESWLGVGQVPAFRGRTYALLKGLVLTDYGNRLPNCTARCTQSAFGSYEDAIESMLTEAGLLPAYFDATLLSSALAPGYYVQGSVTVAQTLQPYMVSGEFLAREEDGVLRFYPREDVPTLTIDAQDLGAHTEGGEAQYPAKVTDLDDMDVPTAVTVTFLDRDKDYQSGSVTERAMGVASRMTGQIRLPLGLETDRARDIAQHALINGRTNRLRLAMNLPPSYIAEIGENKRASVEVFGEDWTTLTQRVDIGPNWLISVEAIREDVEVLEFAESTEAPLSVTGKATTKAPPALRLQIMDTAPLSDAHADRLGFYYAAGSFQENLWGGAVLYASSDGGVSFKYVATVQQRATMGIATTLLADGPIGYWDRANTVTVELDSGELESVTEAECLKGSNRLWLQSGARGEVIGFTTATLVGERTYELSGLLRGLRDTRDYTGTHALGDVCVVLGNGVHFHETNAAGVGVQRIFKLVPNGGAVADAPEHTERLQGYTMRPFAPARVSGSRDGSDNLTVTAVRRSRRLVSLFGEIGSAPADVSASMTYELDIMNGANVLRTITADTPEWEYSAADQALDGLTPGDPVTVRAQAVSEVVGRGNYLEEIV